MKPVRFWRAFLCLARRRALEPYRRTSTCSPTIR